MSSPKAVSSNMRNIQVPSKVVFNKRYIKK